jgi:hypothetical protein
MYLLADDRTDKEFRKISFSGFEKKDVFRALRNQIEKKDPLTTTRWIVEIHSSGWVSELFDFYEQYAVQEIGVGNPRLYPYLRERREDVRKLISGKYSFLETRNDSKMRYVLVEIAMVILYSQQRPIAKLVKIKEGDLKQEDMINRLMFYGKDYQRDYWNDDIDPPSLKGVFNELIGSLRAKILDSVLFWIAWIRLWEEMKGMMPPGDSPENCPVILRTWYGWKIWKIFMKESRNRLVDVLFYLSTRDIKNSSKKLREESLILAATIICEGIDTERPLVLDMERIMAACNSEITDRLFAEVVRDRDRHYEKGGFGLPQELKDKIKEQYFE